jgi:chemotaxis response regulator CheB
VLLSGMMHDGTAGSWEIRRLGGVTIAQDPGGICIDATFCSALILSGAFCLVLGGRNRGGDGNY